jgi:prepilin-type N-terminal cleavage/methylation domain-containing protein
MARIFLRPNSPGKNQKGFTLMEIVVSTTIFAGTLTMMLTLFNYTLKINRRAEALRQATQAVRNLSEFLIKEVRNGRIDYGSPPAGYNPPPDCPQPPTLYNNGGGGDTALGIVNLDGEQECIYWSGTNIYLVKQVGAPPPFPAQRINPPGVDIIDLVFYVRPAGPDVNPYDTTNPPRVQPFVTMLIKFKVQLAGVDAPIIIPYQTSISTDQYDLPH